MKSRLHFLSYTLEFLTCSLLAITILITAVQVFSRFVFNFSFSWSQELLMISFVWFVLFGSALAVKHREHLKIDLIEKLPPGIRLICKIIELFVVFTFIFVFVYYGIILVLDNLKTGQTVGFLPMKVGHVYTAIPVSGLFMLYYTVKDLVNR